MYKTYNYNILLHKLTCVLYYVSVFRTYINSRCKHYRKQYTVHVQQGLTPHHLPDESWTVSALCSFRLHSSRDWKGQTTYALVHVNTVQNREQSYMSHWSWIWWGSMFIVKKQTWTLYSLESDKNILTIRSVTVQTMMFVLWLTGLTAFSFIASRAFTHIIINQVWAHSSVLARIRIATVINVCENMHVQSSWMKHGILVNMNTGLCTVRFVLYANFNPLNESNIVFHSQSFSGVPF